MLHYFFLCFVMKKVVGRRAFFRFLGGWLRDLFVFANLDDILISQRLVGFVVLGVLEQHLVHVGGGILVEPVGAAEDDESDLTIAQHRQFVGFFHDAEFALIERHLLFSVGLFVFPSHCGCGQRRK
jgi:hypothetical protein